MIGIIGAMQEEIDSIISQIENKSLKIISKIYFYFGELEDKEVVVAKSGVGKVNMAMCTQLMIDNFPIAALINIGVAGSADDTLKIGDIVVSTGAVEHDMNVTGLGYQQGIIPDMPFDEFKADENLINLAYEANKNLGSKVIKGVIATGDIFVSDRDMKTKIAHFFNAKCIEMEGGAMAHVAVLNKIPFVIIRAISDDADENSLFNYRKGLERVIANSTLSLKNLVRSI